jgi:hypothetical protein
MELRPDHVFGSNKSMHKGLPLSRQNLNLGGIVEVSDLIWITKTQRIQGLHDTSSHPRFIFIGLTPLTPLSSSFGVTM